VPRGVLPQLVEVQVGFGLAGADMVGSLWLKQNAREALVMHSIFHGSRLIAGSADHHFPAELRLLCRVIHSKRTAVRHWRHKR
jgi:hypothetical protein